MMPEEEIAVLRAENAQQRTQIALLVARVQEKGVDLLAALQTVFTGQPLNPALGQIVPLGMSLPAHASGQSLEEQHGQTANTLGRGVWSMDQ